MRRSLFGISYEVFLFFVLGFLFFALAGCEKITGLTSKKIAAKEEKAQGTLVVKGTIIARINNIPITLEDLNQEVDTLNALAREQNKPEVQINTREKKINYLKDEIVSRILLYQAGLDRGLENKEEVQRTLEKYKQSLLVGELMNEEYNKIEVTPVEIEAYYNQYKEQLREPEERQVREIAVPTEAEAKDILIELLKGADFADLARQRSKAASAANGGDMGFISKGKKFVQFDAVAFSESLEAGQYSNIFKGPDGYYIIKLETKKGGKQRSLSELWDDIKRGLQFLKQQQQIKDLIGKLSQEARIEIYEGEIK